MSGSHSLTAPHAGDLGEVEAFAGSCGTVSSRTHAVAESLQATVAVLTRDNVSATTESLGERSGYTAHDLSRAADAISAWTEAAHSYARELAEISHIARPLAYDRQSAKASMRAIDPTGLAVAFLPMDRQHLYMQYEEVYQATSRHLRALVDRRDGADRAFAAALGAGHDNLGTIPAGVLADLGSSGSPLDAASVSRFLLRAMWEDVEGASGYGLVDLPMFRYDANGNVRISAAQVSQGSFGDCWFIAALMGIAARRPQDIVDMITVNADKGTYTVRFYDEDGNPVYIEVDGKLLLDSDGNTFGAGKFEDKVLWPAIVEKALAEYMGGYAEIKGGDPADALRLITGDTDVHTDNFGNWFAEMWDSDDAGATKFSEILDNGGVIMAGTRSGDDLPEESGLVGYHAYYVTAVDGDTVTVQNPWGVDGNPPLTFTWDEFEKYFRRTRWIE